MTRREWKRKRKRKDNIRDDWEKEENPNRDTVVWAVICFVLYAIALYQFFGY